MKRIEETKLPVGWRWAKIGGPDGIARIVNGSTPSSGESSFWNGDILWTTPADLGQLDDIYLYDTERKITKAGYKSCSTQLLPVGTVLLTSRAPVGNIAIAGREMCTNQGFKSIIPREDVDSLYLYFAIRAIVPAIQKKGHGNTFDELTKPALSQFEIPLPPTFKQQQTIGLELKRKLEEARAIRRVAERQLEASESLHDGFVRTLFPFSDMRHTPEGWTTNPLGELRQSIEYGLSKTSARKPVGPKYVRITDIQDGNVNWDSVPYCECSDAEADSCKLQDGDILFARTGATTGKSYLISNPPNAVFASYLIRVQCNAERVLPEYLYAFFQSHIYWKAIGKDARGGAQAGFNATMLGDLLVPLPPTKDEQKRIADEFRKYGLSAQRIKSGTERQLEAVSALPAATLREFFNFGSNTDV